MSYNIVESEAVDYVWRTLHYSSRDKFKPSRRPGPCVFIISMAFYCFCPCELYTRHDSLCVRPRDTPFIIRLTYVSFRFRRPLSEYREIKSCYIRYHQGCVPFNLTYKLVVQILIWTLHSMLYSFYTEDGNTDLPSVYK